MYNLQDTEHPTLGDEVFVTVDNCSVVPYVGNTLDDKSVKPETIDTEQNFQVMEWPYWRNPLSQVDMEQLAENRGKAMQRYKEKKKTRRQLYLVNYVIHFHSHYLV